MSESPNPRKFVLGEGEPRRWMECDGTGTIITTDPMVSHAFHVAALAAKDAEIERLKVQLNDKEVDLAVWKGTAKQRIAQLESDNKALAAEADRLEEVCRVLGAEIADARLFTDYNETNKNKVPYEASKYRTTRRATDAHPLAPKYVQPRKETQE
jgi:hypothetical protein